MHKNQRSILFENALSGLKYFFENISLKVITTIESRDFISVCWAHGRGQNSYCLLLLLLRLHLLEVFKVLLANRVTTSAVGHDSSKSDIVRRQRIPPGNYEQS